MKIEKKTEEALNELRKRSIALNFSKGRKVPKEDLEFAGIYKIPNKSNDSTKIKLQTEWTINQLSLVTGIDRRTCIKRLAEVSPEKETTNGRIYLSPACFQAVMQTARKKGNAAERLALANAERAERKNNVESLKYIPTDRVAQAWEDLIVLCKQRILNVGNNLESQGKINHEQRLAIDAENKSALAELSKDISYKADKEESENGRPIKISS